MMPDDAQQPARPTRAQLEAVAAGGTMDTEMSNFFKHHDTDGAVNAELEGIRSELGFLDDFVGANQAELQTPAPMTDQIAPEGYEIVRELDRGAQGVVYLGRQLRTKRIVALKMILQSAFATERQRLRFEREVELVASMNHPGIVTVFDSGVSPDGRLFTAMEYIDGVPLNLFRKSDASGTTHALDLEERVQLFLKVCDAVASAHQRGIIHRDLKPLNILVDASASPHVLDFGLAKMVGPEAMNETAMLATAAGEFMGTFAYASPEQVRGDPDLVDTRTDVYALGVILYEILLDSRPYTLGGNILDMIKGIMESKPIPPRSIDPEFNADLETILLMTLAKEPDRRYQSVRDLADDLHRWLANEPIIARRDDTMYVMRKFVQRHRIAVGLAAGFVLLIIAIAITMSVLYAKVTLANHRLAGTLGMASNVIASADPENVQRGSTATTAVDMLLAWSDVVHADLSDDADISSRIYNDLGESFIGFDRYDLAQKHLEQAYFSLSEEDRMSSPIAARALHNLGRVAYKQARWKEAEARFTESLEIRRLKFGSSHPEVADSLHHLGSTHRHLGQTEDAERNMRHALQLYDQLLASADPGQHAPLQGSRGSVLNGLGLLLSKSRPEEAIEFYSQSVALLEHQEDETKDDWRIGRLKHNIGMCHYRLGNLEDASAFIESSLLIKESGLRRLQAESQVVQNADAGNRLQIATGKQALASIMLQMDVIERAEELAGEAYAIRQDVLHAGHYQLTDSNELIARIHLRAGRIEQALSIFEAMHAERILRADDPSKIAWTESNLGQCLLATGRNEEAEPLLLSAWEQLSSDTGAGTDSTSARETAAALAQLYEQTNRPEDAKHYRVHAVAESD
jgi:serine/threonine protein kinase/tetratricopeptide (TPR) repeat protein